MTTAPRKKPATRRKAKTKAKSAAITALATPAKEAAVSDDLEQARGWWITGNWTALNALGEKELTAYSDRARLSLLAAAGAAQLGKFDVARTLTERAQDWGCDRDLIARVLIGGVCNTLGCAASLLQDKDRATAQFDASVTALGTRADLPAMSRARNLAEKARLGLLPDAAQVLGAEFEAMRAERMLTWSREEIFKSHVELLINHTISIAARRGQLEPGKFAVGHTADIGTVSPENAAMSQLGQDLWVLERTENKHGGFFVEFGATNGVILSNTFLLEKHFDWTGICAEPNPDFFATLRENRNCIVSPACIAGRTGETVDFILAEEYGGIADHAGLDNNASIRTAYQDDGKVITLETISLDDFLKSHDAPRDIDYLSIDTEGSEYEILSNFPFEDWNIRLITVEHNFTADRARIQALLEGYGYHRTEARWDDWYERPDLAPGAAPIDPDQTAP